MNDPRDRSRRPRTRTLVGVLLGALVVLNLVTGFATGTMASLSAEDKNSSNNYASTALPLPVIVSSHTAVTSGMVTVTWSSTPSSFATSYQIQRSTSSSGPFTTVATVTTGQSGFTEYSIPTASSQPGGITWGPDGNLWFTEVSGNKIGKITTSGTITEYSVPTASAQPMEIVSGPDGNLWFTEYGANKVAKVTTSGTFTEYNLVAANSQPRGITVGSDGNLWVAEQNNNKIAKITTSGTVTEYGGLNAGSQPYDITSGPDNQIYFSQNSNSKIGSILTDGTGLTQTATPTAAASPKGIVVGPTGNVRFTESAKDKIGKYPPYYDSLTLTDTGTGITASSQPTMIAPMADGKNWFTELNGNKLASIDSSNTVVEVSVPTAASQPTGITAGPDGNVWFTEAAGNKIGMRALGLSNSWVDTTAAYNTQYHYQVVAVFQNWTRTSAVESALSLNPTSGTDATAASPAAISAANLTNLSLADNLTHNVSTTWAQSEYTSNNLTGVSMINATTGWAVGASGTVLYTTDGGISWTTQTSNTAQGLNYVWALDSTHVWAVGQSGTIDFYNGTSWATQTSNTAANLNAVWALDSTHVWAVGAGGVIDFYNGTSWATQTSNTAVNLNGVHGLDSSHVWAVGDTINDFYNGTSWATQASNTANHLKEVRAIDTTHVWAVGDKQTVDFFNGTTWATQSTGGTTNNIHGLIMLDATHGWGFAASSKIYKWDGNSWTDVSPTTNGITGNFESAWAADSNRFIAVGASGLQALSPDGGTNWLPISKQYVEYRFSGAPSATTALNSVSATLVFKPASAPSTSTFWLFASPDAGASWSIYSLTSPGAASTITDTVDLTSVVNTPTKVQNLYLRFFNDSASAYKTNHDLVQVQVN